VSCVAPARRRHSTFSRSRGERVLVQMATRPARLKPRQRRIGGRSDVSRGGRFQVELGKFHGSATSSIPARRGRGPAPGCGRGPRVRSPSTPDGARISSWRSNSSSRSAAGERPNRSASRERGPIGPRSPGSCPLLAEVRHAPSACSRPPSIDHGGARAADKWSARLASGWCALALRDLVARRRGREAQ
jgi:hypothetical protein